MFEINNPSKGSILCLLGPTASGKSAWALAYAKQHPVEIISVDSALIYRGMDIGTAKPSVVEQSVCPHHLIDICDPEETYSVSAFCQAVFRLIPEIHARGRMPLLVGGTMLYFKALWEGLSTLPASSPVRHAHWEQRLHEEGLVRLYQYLQKVDARAAAQIDSHDSQRIIRALDVYEHTGKPLSEHWQQSEKRECLSDHGTVHVMGKMPEERAQVHQAIETRFDAMLAMGFLDEVMQLKQRPELSSAHPSMRAVGYRQAWSHLENEMDFQTFRAKALAVTRQLAKRQWTWIRGFEKQGLEIQRI